MYHVSRTVVTSFPHTKLDTTLVYLSLKLVYQSSLVIQTPPSNLKNGLILARETNTRGKQHVSYNFNNMYEERTSAMLEMK